MTDHCASNIIGGVDRSERRTEGGSTEGRKGIPSLSFILPLFLSCPSVHSLYGVDGGCKEDVRNMKKERGGGTRKIHKHRKTESGG
jgi:hypothetical protein